MKTSMKTTRPAARICCLDLDTFFVSVERLHRPDLCGQPVVVGALPGQRGVVTAASYEVREHGVRSGMPISEAYRRAPHATYVPTRHGEYSRYSRQVQAILEQFSPVVRAASIDEFFLDFRDCEALYRDEEDGDDDQAIERAVRKMRQAIQDELGLPASAGIAVTRPIAKMASGAAKPAGVLLVPSGAEQAFVQELPIRRWPGIGPVAEQRWHARGVETIGQLLARGGSTATAIRQVLAGVSQETLGGDRPAFREHDPQGRTSGSLSNERTFSNDEHDVTVLREELHSLCERVCYRARQRGVLARTVAIKLRYANFQTVTRAQTLSPTNAESTVMERVDQLFQENYARPRRVRLVGVCLSNLVSGQQQLPLPFMSEGRSDVSQAIDAIRDQLGYDAIHLGRKKKDR